MGQAVFLSAADFFNPIANLQRYRDKTLRTCLRHPLSRTLSLHDFSPRSSTSALCVRSQKWHLCPCSFPLLRVLTSAKVCVSMASHTVSTAVSYNPLGLCGASERSMSPPSVGSTTSSSPWLAGGRPASPAFFFAQVPQCVTLQSAQASHLRRLCDLQLRLFISLVP